MKKRLKIALSITFIMIFLIAIIWIIIYLFPSLKELFVNKSDILLRNTLKELGIIKYIIIIFLQMFQVILSVVPGEPVQLLSGITCGPLYGFLACMIGVFLGNTFIFLGIRTFGFIKEPLTTKNKNNVQIVEEANANKSIRGVTIAVLGMYFTPAIPYGIICYTAAKSKMSYLRYIIITTLGTIPSVISCLAFSLLLIHSPIILDNYLPLLIIGIIIALIIFLIVKFHSEIIKHILNRSIRATILWLIPLFSVSIAISSVVLSKRIFPKKTIIIISLLIVFIVLILLYICFNKSIAKVFTRKKMEDFRKDVKKPNAFTYAIFSFFIKLYYFNKFKIKVHKENITKLETPSFVLFNHPSKYDFIYSTIPLRPQKINMVTAYYYFCNFHLGRLLNHLGAIPKFLYQPDISAVKNIKKVISNNGIVGIAPEGRLSAYGCMESYIPSTAKLIKKEQINVYLAKIDGSYFSAPKWATTSRTGRIDVTFSLILTKEQISQMSIEEIYKYLYNELYYDEYEWQEKNHVYFKGKKLIEGLEQILYICPVCKNEFTYQSHDNEMICSHCHTKVTLDNYYELHSDNTLIPKNIRDWYLMQKNIEKEKIQDPNYSLSSKVILKNPDPKGLGFTKVGDGIATLTKDGISYIGSLNNEQVTKMFKLENIPALPFGVKEDFEIYQDNTLYYFIPENIRSCVKWSVVEEQMYEDYIKKNNIKVWEK